MAMNKKTPKIIKYADDIVIRLIENNDETPYRDAMQYVTVVLTELSWFECHQDKREDDFRKKKNKKDHIHISSNTG